MAISNAFTGSETTSTTEWSCTTDTAGPDVETSDGVFQVWLLVSSMAAGDELEIKFYEKVQSTDTQRVFYQANLVGEQEPPIWVSPSFVLMHGWDVTIKAVAGTPTIDWAIRKIT